MDTPRFAEHPVTNSELETCYLLAFGNTPDEVASIRGLSTQTIYAQTRSVRYKYHAPSTDIALVFMIALGHIEYGILTYHVQPHWKQYQRL